MNSPRRSGVILALLCATATATADALTATPAQAQPAPPTGVLVLDVRPADQTGDQAGDQTGVPARTVLLRCGVDGGGHAAAAAACADLRAVAGDIGAMTAGDEICTYEYAPVTATAAGVWHGRPVSYRATFPNRCVLLQNTGNVFNF